MLSPPPPCCSPQAQRILHQEKMYCHIITWKPCFKILISGSFIYLSPTYTWQNRNWRPASAGARGCHLFIGSWLPQSWGTSSQWRRTPSSRRKLHNNLTSGLSAGSCRINSDFLSLTWRSWSLQRPVTANLPPSPSAPSFAPLWCYPFTQEGQPNNSLDRASGSTAPWAPCSCARSPPGRRCPAPSRRGRSDGWTPHPESKCPTCPGNAEATKVATEMARRRQVEPRMSRWMRGIFGFGMHMSKENILERPTSKLPLQAILSAAHLQARQAKQKLVQPQPHPSNHNQGPEAWQVSVEAQRQPGEEAEDRHPRRGEVLPVTGDPEEVRPSKGRVRRLLPKHVYDLSIYISVCLSVCLSVSLSVCLSVCLSINLSIYLKNLCIWSILCVYVYIHTGGQSSSNSDRSVSHRPPIWRHGPPRWIWHWLPRKRLTSATGRGSTSHQRRVHFLTLEPPREGPHHQALASSQRDGLIWSGPHAVTCFWHRRVVSFNIRKQPDQPPSHPALNAKVFQTPRLHPHPSAPPPPKPSRSCPTTSNKPHKNRGGEPSRRVVRVDAPPSWALQTSQRPRPGRPPASSVRPAAPDPKPKNWSLGM